MTQPTVFISYSHEDEQEKHALVSHLGVLASEGLVDVWVDDRIGAGGDWQQEISQAIAQAKVAILLITANFLTSDFILNQELPELLKRHQNEGLVVFPIIAKACAWKGVAWLSKMKVRPKNGKPVWSDNRSDVDSVLADIAEEVMDVVTPKAKQSSSAASTVLDDESQTIDLGAPFAKGLHIGEFSIRGCTIIVRNVSIALGILLVFGIVAALFNNPNIRGLIIHPYETAIAVVTTPTLPTHTPTSTPTNTATATDTPRLVFQDFETASSWERGDQPYGDLTRSTTQVRSGSFAGQLTYNFPSVNNDFVVFRQTSLLDGQPNAISAWIYGDNSGNFLNVWILDAQGEIWSMNFGEIRHSGWQQMIARLDENRPWPSGHIEGPSNGRIDYPISFYALQLDNIPDSSGGQGSIYIDDLGGLSDSSPIPTDEITTPPTPTPTIISTPTTITPLPPHQIALTASSNLINQGQCVLLSWEIHNVTAAYLNGDGVTGPNDSKTVCPTSTTSTLRLK